MTELTHEELTRLLDYDPETGVFTRKVSNSKVKAGAVAGYKHPSGNMIRIKSKSYMLRHLAWFYVNGEMPRDKLFVKNGDRYDDRIENIGVAPDKPKELTHEYLKQCIDYDPETGVFRWKVGGGGVKAGSVAGTRSESGNGIGINGTTYTSRHLAWFYVYGEMPRNNLFVKNGDRHDDRISNLGMLPDKPKELTHEYLKQCIDYNPDTGEFKWKITQGTNVYGNDAFCISILINNRISLHTRILDKTYMTTRLIVFWMTGYMPSPNRLVITVDNNALNLKWSNIKVGNSSEAQIKKRNMGMVASKGVSFYNERNKYAANITKNGEKKFLGYYTTEHEAHEAYMKAARKHFGELANDGYNHAMYEMEYEPVEQDPVAEELVTSMEQAVDIAEGKLEPTVVHEVGF